MKGPHIQVTADGAQVNAVFNQISRKGDDLARHLGSTVKTALVGYFSVEAVKSAVQAMAQFAEEVQKTSERLDITVEQVQLLRTTARHAGTDMGMWEKAFLKMGKARSDALRGQSIQDVTKLNAMTALGLSKETIGNTNPNAIGKMGFVKEALKGTIGMPQGKAEELLDTIFGKGAGRKMLMQRKEILEGKFDAVSAGVIAQMDELTDAFEDLKENILKELLPAFIRMVNWINQKFGGHPLVKEAIRQNLAFQSALVASGKKPEDVGFMSGDYEYGEFIAAKGLHKAAQPFRAPLKSEWKGTREEWEKQDDAEWERNYLQKRFGFQGMVSFLETRMKLETKDKDEREQVEKDKADREKQRAERNAARARGDVVLPSEDIVKKQKQKAEKLSLMETKDLVSQDLVKVGGMLGVDATYRMERLTVQTNQLLQQIVDNTSLLKDLVNNQEQPDSSDINDF